MSGLQQLQKLTVAGRLPELSFLLVQLRAVDLGYCEHSQQLGAVMPLQQLPALSCVVGFEQQEPLLRLTQLPALQELGLFMMQLDWMAAVATAPAWGRLPQLRHLELQCCGLQGTRPQLAAVIAGSAAATALTKLVLWLPRMIDDLDAGEEQQAVEDVGGGQQRGPLDICASIAGLTRLKHLEITGLQEVATSAGLASGLPGDVLALTALTALTHLRLSDGGACVGDAAAVALACSLKALRHLDLSDCGLGAMACLGAIAHLRQLSCLHSQGNPGITPQGLMMLTRLHNSTTLVVDKNDEMSDDVLKSFWLSTARCLRSSKLA
uniref:Uncharacterized protein n=1 Tax=Tetradesmus obliquus TaxID=3088 RepID=A0A383W682_TETOB|eukprot:jgi/Sobl393_1/15744/SZX73155.1